MPEIALNPPPFNPTRGNRTGSGCGARPAARGRPTRRSWRWRIRGWGLGRVLPPQLRAARYRVGARQAAPVQRSVAARQRRNRVPQVKRVSPRRGAASRARPARCRSAAAPQSCTAGKAGLSASGRGKPRPSSALLRRGSAAIVYRNDHEALPLQPRAARSRAPMCHVMLNGTPV